jgi:hypothetical protein
MKNSRGAKLVADDPTRLIGWMSCRRPCCRATSRIADKRGRQDYIKPDGGSAIAVGGGNGATCRA